MKHRTYVVAYFMFVFLLGACSGSRPSTAIITSPSPSITLTKLTTETVIDDRTSTMSPARLMNTPDTATVPLPNTTTPTLQAKTATETKTAFFDPSTNRTATPAPSAQCPKPYSRIVPTPQFLNPDGEAFLVLKEEDVLDYLNQYGAEALDNEYQKTNGKNWTGSIQAYRDLTNDGVPELVIGWGNFYIFGCEDGEYKTLGFKPADGYLMSPKIMEILDANRNGKPEILLLTSRLTQGETTYQIIEWDGKQFQDLLVIPGDDLSSDLFIQSHGQISFDDLDKDGIQEFVATIGIPTTEVYIYGIPWRQEKQVYTWDGKRFTLSARSFSEPEYRFQAVQDGDRATREGNYDSALNFYQQAIFSDKLEWWSPERWEYLRNVFMNAFSKSPTPIPPPTDTKEDDNLAAYSRYRIMLLHLSRGRVSDAEVVYDTLQKKFPEGKPGHVYVGLAENVWNEFSQTKDLGKACDKALEFVSHNNESIFYYISGSGFTGNHGINYKDNPEMICPFE